VKHRPRNRFLRAIHARPRTFLSAVVAILVGVLLPTSVAAHFVTRALIAWNAGTVLYVVLAATMMTRSSPQKMRYRAQLQDDGQRALLLFSCLAVVASIAGMAGELAVSKDIHGFLKSAHIALASVTVLSSWAFIQMTFALHYAHDYYAAVCHGRPVGLRFPDDPDPDYGDFFYFSAIIGTSGQTADVAFVSKPMRRIGSLHCVLAYLFNTTVLALLINIAASLV
jgi:uncharacterized membrane protein